MNHATIDNLDEIMDVFKQYSASALFCKTSIAYSANLSQSSAVFALSLAF